MSSKRPDVGLVDRSSCCAPGVRIAIIVRKAIPLGAIGAWASELIVVGFQKVWSVEWLLIVPGIINGVVKASGVPGQSVSCNDFWQGLPLVVGVGAEVQIGQTVTNGQRDAVTFN